MARLSANGTELHRLESPEGRMRVSIREVTRKKTGTPIRILVNHAWTDSQGKRNWDGWKRRPVLDESIATGRRTVEGYVELLESKGFKRS